MGYSDCNITANRKCKMQFYFYLTSESCHSTWALKDTLFPLCCGLKMFNSLNLSPASCLSPKFSGLIKVTIPSVNPASERAEEEGIKIMG